MCLYLFYYFLLPSNYKHDTHVNITNDLHIQYSDVQNRKTEAALNPLLIFVIPDNSFLIILCKIIL